jgi:hypothetical protein
MSKEILVAVKPDDRIEDMIPCLDKVAQPGTKVTFFFRYPVDGFASSPGDVRPSGRFGGSAETRTVLLLGRE